MDIIVTDTAINRIKEILQEENKPNINLRIFVQGGGCSGFQYGFDLDETQGEDDFIIEKNGIKLLVDSMSYQYLIGATIDFKDDVYGSAFSIDNPNATTTCGCGSSFNI